jgi:hypothetical protein
MPKMKHPFEKGASAMDGARKGKCQEAAFSRRREEPLKGFFAAMLKRSPPLKKGRAPWRARGRENARRQHFPGGAKSR